MNRMHNNGSDQYTEMCRQVQYMPHEDTVSHEAIKIPTWQWNIYVVYVTI